MLNWETRLGVNGVGVLLATLVIEVAVVSACGHCLVGDVEHGLYFGIHVRAVLYGFVDAYLPRHPFFAIAACYNLSAYLNHEIGDVVLAQKACHNVCSVAFGDGRTVEHHLRMALPNAFSDERNLVVANELHQAVNLLP